MKAAVLRAPNEFVVDFVATPKAGPGELVLRVKAATVCGTDIRILRGRKTKGVRFPSILGHEFAGEVVDVGPGVTQFSCGDRVCADPVMPCRACAYCKMGRENVCSNRQAIGYEFDGAFAEFLRVPAVALQSGNVVRMPEGMRYEAAALAEPLACCLNGMRNAEVGFGDAVVVIGAGPIGLMHAALARRAGARLVVMSEPNPGRRQAAAERGVDRTVDPSAEDLGGIVRGLTDGLGADVVILAIGAAPLANEALGLVRKGGRVNLFAGFATGDAPAMDVNAIHYNEIAVTGASALSRRDYEMALQLLATGQIDAASLITHRFGIADAVAALAEAESGRALKVVITDG
jgi:L-iditol 2-dehydrogenase